MDRIPIGLLPYWLGQLCVYAAIASLALPFPPTILVAGVAVGGGLLLLDGHKAGGRRDPVIMVFCGLFLLFTLISLLLSREMSRAAIASVSLIPAVFLGLLVGFKMNPRWLRQLNILFSLMVLFASAYLLSVVLSHPTADPSEWMRLSGYRLLSVPNDLLFLALLSPFPLSLLFCGPSWSKKVLGMAALVSVVAICVLFNSRAGVILLIFAIMLMLPQLSLRLLVSVILGFFLLFFVIDLFNNFNMLEKMVGFWTASSRIPLWLAAWKMFLDAPLFGLGPGAFSEHYQAYLATIALPDWIVFDSRHMPWAHNLYMEVLAERGILSFGVLILIFARALSVLWHEKTKASSHGLAVQAYFVSFSLVLVAGFFELSLLRLWFVVFFFLMIGIVLFISSKGTAHETKTE